MNPPLRSITPRQSEDAPRQDGSLDFTRARFDRVAARPQISIDPLAAIELLLLGAVPQDLHGRPRLPLVHLAPKQLQDRSLGPRRCVVRDPRQGPIRVQPEDLQFQVRLGDFLPVDRVLRQRLAVLSERLGSLNQLIRAHEQETPVRDPRETRPGSSVLSFRRCRAPSAPGIWASAWSAVRVSVRHLLFHPVGSTSSPFPAWRCKQKAGTVLQRRRPALFG